MEGATPFPGLLHFTLDPYLIMLSVKQGVFGMTFLSLWYDSTWDWTQVSQTIGELSTHLANGPTFPTLPLSCGSPQAGMFIFKNTKTFQFWIDFRCEHSYLCRTTLVLYVWHYINLCLSVCLSLYILIALSAVAVEYTDCISAEE